MKAIETLMHEHQFILKVLDALDRYNESFENNGNPDHTDFAGFAAFFSDFADKCHHGKEEDILFDEMLKHGFSKVSGPLAVMFHEHTLGREQIRQLRETGSNADAAAEDIERARNAASVYSQLLRQHIYKEDNVLYPMAVQRLPKQLLESMEGQFDDFEKSEMGNGTHESLHSLGEELIAKYSG